jgi:small neutral amino acid transporter SnatA (MarC family)
MVESKLEKNPFSFSRNLETCMDETTTGLVLIGIGILTMVGAFLNWRIVVGPGKLIPRLLGPTGARILMILVGLALVGLGISIYMGLV